MQLEGLHHVTAMTADAQSNIDFYAGVLGLRLVKKTVNFDAPEMYHLYFGDETGTPGSVLTFFEIRGAARGRAGAGMVHRVDWRVADEAALDFWQVRLEVAGTATTRGDGWLDFADPEGLAQRLVVDRSGDATLTAADDEIPDEHALRGFAGVRAYAADPEASGDLFQQRLGFERAEDGWRVAGAARSATYAFDPAPEARGLAGAGTVHHIAFASPDADHEAWLQVARDAGRRPSPVLDRSYFRSIYFREPSGVLFEIATLSPGFAIDEPVASLGETLRLPPQFEPHRAAIEAALTPVGVRRQVVRP
jgi:glyoxalase family protein